MIRLDKSQQGDPRAEDIINRLRRSDGFFSSCNGLVYLSFGQTVMEDIIRWLRCGNGNNPISKITERYPDIQYVTVEQVFDPFGHPDLKKYLDGKGRLNPDYLENGDVKNDCPVWVMEHDVTTAAYVLFTSKRRCKVFLWARRHENRPVYCPPTKG